MKSDTDSGLLVRDIEIFNDIRNYIRRKINNADNKFFGDDFSNQREETMKLLTQSIENRESNSAIICGSPGCGKTALINNVLKELYVSGFIDNENAVVIRLNGLLHRDDRLALQDIRKQLKVSYAEDVKKFSSFQENLLYLLDKLKEEGEANFNPCVVIVLDEFHLFCEHKNQILLYNLFDIAQSSKAPLCIIGLTYFTDVMNLMEKRVLSRFSHRIIWMTESVKLEERLKLFHDIFTLHPSDLPNIDEIYKLIWNKRTDELVENREVKEILKRQMDIDSSQAKFRNILHKLFNTVTFELPLLNVESIKYVFSIQDSYASILARLSLLEMALLEWEGDILLKEYVIILGSACLTRLLRNPKMNPATTMDALTFCMTWLATMFLSFSPSLMSYFRNFRPKIDRQVWLRRDIHNFLLSISQVIAVKHQSIAYSREPFNFEMIYNRYLKFSSSNATNLVTERSVVLKAFQRIQELEIIVPIRKSTGNTLGKVPLEYQLYHSNLTDDQINEAVRLNRDLTADLRQWAVQSL